MASDHSVSGEEVISNKQVILKDYASGFPKESNLYLTTSNIKLQDFIVLSTEIFQQCVMMSSSINYLSTKVPTEYIH